jgi:hypothetical protein
MINGDTALGRVTSLASVGAWNFSYISRYVGLLRRLPCSQLDDSAAQGDRHRLRTVARP